jgi:hypothetical protein
MHPFCFTAVVDNLQKFLRKTNSFTRCGAKSNLGMTTVCNNSAISPPGALFTNFVKRAK